MYYIVYITKNIINNKQYIGVHKTDNASVFDGYIGCGVNIHKPASYNNPKTPFQYAVKKYGTKNFVRSVIKIFNTKEEAFKLESELVTTEIIYSGEYYNCKLGGEFSGGVPKKVYQYQLNGAFLKEWFTQEACSFYSIDENTMRTAISTNSNTANFYWSRDKVDKLDTTKYGKPNIAKPVYQYSLNGVCIGVYKSIQSTPGDSSGIYNAIHCKREYCGSYYAHELVEKFIPEKINLKTKIIYAYNSEGNYVAEAKGVKAILEKLNLPYKSQVAVCIKSNKPYKGYRLLLEKVDKAIPIQSNDSKKEVNVYDIYGNLLKTYTGVNEACRELGLNTGSVHRVLNGVARQHKGYILKYKDI